MQTSEIVTLCDLCSQRIELFRRRLSLCTVVTHCPFNPGDRTACTLGSMVLLHDIIQILRLSNDNGPPMSLPSTTVESNGTALEEMVMTARVLV